MFVQEALADGTQALVYFKVQRDARWSYADVCRLSRKARGWKIDDCVNVWTA